MSEHAPIVVVIEDERQIRRFLRSTLEAEGYQVFEAETGRQGLTEAATRKPDLAIVDLGLPDLDGVDVVRQLREWSSIPVLVLSARTGEWDKVRALDQGADDYLTKPFGTAELLARLRVALRRRATDYGAGRPGAAFIVAGLTVDLTTRAVTLDGREVHLTPIEYRLLAELVRHAGKVLTHRHLLREVWGPSHVDRSHYLHIYMGQLRHKLEQQPARPRFLLTEVGVGYRLAAE
jgi:two-component system, OmpR family, KDP operon response regulator KdpE